jgi:hypothetical protein
LALYGVSFTATYVAWDTVNNVGKTGDVVNHTLRWVKDGVSAAPANAAAEVDPTNAPGVYKVTLTAGEAQAICATLSGKSSSSGIAIMPITFTFERLPNVAPGAAGGLPTVDGSNGVLLSVGTGTGQLNPIAGQVAVGQNNDKNSYTLSSAGLDAIPIIDPGGVAGQTTFPRIVVALYRRFFDKATVTATQLRTYKDDGSTVNTTQVLADDGTTQTQGKAT